MWVSPYEFLPPTHHISFHRLKCESRLSQSGAFCERTPPDFPFAAERENLVLNQDLAAKSGGPRGVRWNSSPPRAGSGRKPGARAGHEHRSSGRVRTRPHAQCEGGHDHHPCSVAELDRVSRGVMRPHRNAGHGFLKAAPGSCCAGWPRPVLPIPSGFCVGRGWTAGFIQLKLEIQLRLYDLLGKKRADPMAPGRAGAGPSPGGFRVGPAAHGNAPPRGKAGRW